MSFVKIDELLPSLATRAKNSRSLQAAYIVEIVQKEIDSIFDSNPGENIRVIRYSRGVLTLGISASVWAQEMRMHERRLFQFAEGKFYLSKIRYISI